MSTLCTSTCTYILFLVALEVLIDWRVTSRWNIHVLFSSNCTYLGMQDPKSQHINCLIVIRSKYATHIHHVFKNCLLGCARFAIYYTLAHSMFHRLLKFAFFVLLYVGFSSSSSSYSEQIFYYYVFNAVLIICKLM